MSKKYSVQMLDGEMRYGTIGTRLFMFCGQRWNLHTAEELFFSEKTGRFFLTGTDYNGPATDKVWEITEGEAAEICETYGEEMPVTCGGDL